VFVDIYCDGVFVDATSVEFYTDSNLGKGGETYIYQVCADGIDNFSNYAT